MIPSGLRFPVQEYLENPNEFVHQTENQFPYREYYFESNPSIVKLPHSQVPQNVRLLGSSNFYLATFRFSNAHKCIGMDHVRKLGFRQRLDRHAPGHGQGLCRSPVAVAVLDHNLNIMRMTVFQINCSWEDHRLFVLPDESRSGEPQLYLASFSKIRALWLVPPVIQNKKGQQNLLPGIEWVTPLINSNHSTTLDVAISEGGVDFSNGKNFQYFVGAQNFSTTKYWKP